MASFRTLCEKRPKIKIFNGDKMKINEETLLHSEARYDELSMLLSDPAIASDPRRSVELAREFSELEPLVQKSRRLRELRTEIRDNQELLSETEDGDFRALIREEIAEADREAEKLEREIAEDLVPEDPLDGKNVIVEIRAGAGGDEAALFAQELMRMYIYYAEKRGWSYDLIDSNETELGGIKEATFTLSGKGVYSELKFESGTHRVQRVPATEAGGRIHTSTVTVAVLPEADEVDVDIRPEDLQIDTYRSSGAGGQHVNKTSSAIRITHLPTGMVVTCQDQRSQLKNKERAMQVLRSRLLEKERTERDAAIAASRKSQVGSGDRSERIRTYNFPQGRVTDHRIGLTLYQLDSVLNGEIQPFIQGLQAMAHEEMLKETEAHPHDHEMD